MQPFDYLEPTTVEEAVTARAAAGDEGVVLAGGQTLLIMLRMRLSAPAMVISLRSVAGLGGSSRWPMARADRAMATYRSVAERTSLPAALSSREQQERRFVHIRELGTVGGAVAHAGSRR